jgi:hypothetical protein
MIIMGSPTVLIGGLMAARIGDPTEHGGVIVLGAFTVLIGESGSGAGGGGGGGGGGDDSDDGDDGDASDDADAVSSGDTQSSTMAAAAASGAPFVESCGQ